MNEVQPRLKLARPLDLGAQSEFRLGGLRVDPATRTVFAGGRKKSVEPRVMQVLVALARAEGVVSRDQLIDRCWGGRIVGDDAINSCLAKVRALRDFGEGPSFEIETIPRVGYRLRRSAERPENSPAKEKSGRQLWWHFWGAAAVLAVLAAAYASRLWFDRPANTWQVASYDLVANSAMEERMPALSRMPISLSIGPLRTLLPQPTYISKTSLRTKPQPFPRRRRAGAILRRPGHRRGTVSPL